MAINTRAAEDRLFVPATPHPAVERRIDPLGSATMPGQRCNLWSLARAPHSFSWKSSIINTTRGSVAFNTAAVSNQFVRKAQV